MMSCCIFVSVYYDLFFLKSYEITTEEMLRKIYSVGILRRFLLPSGKLGKYERNIPFLCRCISKSKLLGLSSEAMAVEQTTQKFEFQAEIDNLLEIGSFCASASKKVIDRYMCA